LNEKVTEALELLDQPACTVKVRGSRVVWSNASFQKRFGDVTSFLDIVREDCYAETEAQLSDLDGPETIVHAVIGPESASFEWLANPNEDGTITLLAAAPAPILRRLDALDRKNRQLEEFVYVVSHDLNEPLRMVTSFTQLLEEDYGDALDGEAKTYIQFASQGASRMRQQLKDLLRYSRINTRGNAPEQFEMNKAVDAACEQLQERIQEAGAKVTADELGEAFADFHQIVELFVQLIDNAIQFKSDAPPEVHITSEATNGWRTFAVTDNGIGLEPEQHQRMLQIFKRLQPRVGTGTGVGLALCRRIVERHGGSIRLDGRDEGTGLRVSFTLPARST
jgi:light-regulated signal transduction histidine kinase (bacteriophytochrome)